MNTLPKWLSAGGGKDGKLGNMPSSWTSGEIVLGVSKMNLWHFDRDLYEPGRSFDVVDSPFGRIGLLISPTRVSGNRPGALRDGADLIIDSEPHGLRRYPSSAQPAAGFHVAQGFPEQGMVDPLRQCGEVGGGPRGRQQGDISEGACRFSKRTGRVLFADIDLPGKGSALLKGPPRCGVLARPPSLPVTGIASPRRPLLRGFSWGRQFRSGDARVHPQGGKHLAAGPAARIRRGLPPAFLPPTSSG